ERGAGERCAPAGRRAAPAGGCAAAVVVAADGDRAPVCAGGAAGAAGAAAAFAPVLDAAAGFGDAVFVPAAGRAAGRLGASSAGCVASASSSPSVRALAFAGNDTAAAGRGFDSRTGASPS